MKHIDKDYAYLDHRRPHLDSSARGLVAALILSGAMLALYVVAVATWFYFKD